MKLSARERRIVFEVNKLANCRRKLTTFSRVKRYKLANFKCQLVSALKLIYSAPAKGNSSKQRRATKTTKGIHISGRLVAKCKCFALVGTERARR